MFWKKNPNKNETPKEKHLFREAFLPEKKAIVPKRPTKQSPKWRFPGAVLLWVVFLSTVVYVLFASSFHSVTDISISGSATLPEDRLKIFLRDRMAGRFVSLFPKDNFFLLSSDGVQRDLLESFPKLRAAEVRKRFPNRMDASVSERDRILLWCVSGSCFLLGDDGRLRDARFAEQPENEPFLFWIEDSGARIVADGDAVFDQDTLARFFRLEEELRESGIVTFLPRVVTPSRVSGEFRFVTTEGWELLVSTDPDPETTVSTLRVVLSKELPDEKRRKLRSIDLRTEKKVFFSFIPEEPVAEDAIKDDKVDR